MYTYGCVPCPHTHRKACSGVKVGDRESGGGPQKGRPPCSQCRECHPVTCGKPFLIWVFDRSRGSYSSLVRAERIGGEGNVSTINNREMGVP